MSVSSARSKLSLTFNDVYDISLQCSGFAKLKSYNLGKSMGFWKYNWDLSKGKLAKFGYVKMEDDRSISLIGGLCCWCLWACTLQYHKLTSGSNPAEVFGNAVY